jgi:selenoprotein W-related protein
MRWRNEALRARPYEGVTPSCGIASEASSMTGTVTIRYCTQCRWLLRATWMAQELLTTFSDELEELTLSPGSGGVFEVFANGKRIWCRKEAGRFPEITELKQLVRDEIAPGRDLGHADIKNA